jgi:GcrA cell cycle regulator
MEHSIKLSRLLRGSSMSWTDERVELLKKLWSDGLSASRIAAQLGGITRNAVIGKVHRLRLSGRGRSVSGSSDFIFCGGNAVAGLPYCAYHCRIAYRPAADRRRSGTSCGDAAS